ncbi:unnamed protein product, partial [Discosporangium mesarthrocarpum]
MSTGTMRPSPLLLAVLILIELCQGIRLVDSRHRSSPVAITLDSPTLTFVLPFTPGECWGMQMEGFGATSVSGRWWQRPGHRRRGRESGRLLLATPNSKPHGGMFPKGQRRAPKSQVEQKTLATGVSVGDSGAPGTMGEDTPPSPHMSMKGMGSVTPEGGAKKVLAPADLAVSAASEAKNRAKETAQPTTVGRGGPQKAKGSVVSAGSRGGNRHAGPRAQREAHQGDKEGGLQVARGSSSSGLGAGSDGC